MKLFNPSRKFRRDYNRIFSKDPAAANMLLLFCELANEKGQVKTSDEELAALFNARFGDNPQRYNL